MGAKQSQEEGSTVTQLPPAHAPVVSSAREEESILVPSFFSPFSSSARTNTPPDHEPLFQDRSRTQTTEDEVTEPPPLPVRPFFPVSVRDEDFSLEPPRHRSSSAHQHRERSSHHHHNGSSGHGHESGQDRTRHHRRHHHHHHHRGEHERRSHDRRARRYVYGELDSTGPLELDFSLMALNQRLRDLQQSRESEENGTSSSSSPSGRRHGRSGSHSHSRNQVSASMPAGSLFFMRPSHRKSTCPFCRKDFPSSEMDTHVVMCMTKPRMEYNEDRLIQDAGECSICLDDMSKGDAIARLPCLCVYHIKCLKLWYEKNQTCPEHPEFVTS